MSLPKVAITMGDPAGVGPELCLKVLSAPAITDICEPVVFGDGDLLERVSRHLGLQIPNPESQIRNCNSIKANDVTPGRVSQETGKASYEYICQAIDAALAGEVKAVVTCPINKEAWQQADIKYPGHTELFAERSATDRFCMMMTAPAFSCSLVTTHVGYFEVPDQLTVDRIVEVTLLTYDALKRIHGREPRLMMLGLNPHAGEAGLFGNGEEEKVIAPAVKALTEKGIQITGPVPPDTAFLKSKREETDGYICMYHDQGLIPFKALNFDTGVNITLGLSRLVRTSVDHGTALDIAWKGLADESSLIAAIQLAAQLS